MDLSCFCASCRQREGLPLLQIIFSRMFAQRTALDDRGSVSLCSTGLVYLLFRITKIICSPGKGWQACLQPITKDWGFLTSGPLSCNILLYVEVSSGPVCLHCGN